MDYMLLAPTPNMFYLTGLETSPDERLQLLIVPGEGPLEVVIPEMYAETAEEKGINSIYIPGRIMKACGIVGT